MPDLKDGETAEMKGSGAKPYVLKNVGGVYSCSCPSWRNQSTGVIRTCKHLRKLRGEAAEEQRMGTILAAPVADTKKVTAPPVLLAHTYTPDIDPTGYIMSEKLDGVRAWWDGENFISRLGNVYHAPDWFKEGLPCVVLDGELWMGRKMFQQCVSVVRRQDKSDDWTSIEYVVFDAPKAPGVFMDRIKYATDLLLELPEAHATLLAQTVCKGPAHLKKYLKQIEDRGGEGVMLRQADSLYEEGRSNTLLKVKSFMDDEAVIVAHEPGKGKHKGRVGALVVKLKNGTQFSVGTGLSDKEREQPPAVGETITFRYQELSNTGVPRFPSYVGVRED